MNGEFYFLAEINGNVIKKLLPDDGRLELGGLTAGELLAEVRHYMKGELIKTYKVEPLIIKEVEGKLSAEPEIIAVCREMDGIKEIFDTDRVRAAEREESLKTAIKELEEQVKLLQTNVTALLRFAFDDYMNNVYLGGESVEEFIEQYGFELTGEQKEKLKGAAWKLTYYLLVISSPKKRETVGKGLSGGWMSMLLCGRPLLPLPS